MKYSKLKNKLLTDQIFVNKLYVKLFEEFCNNFEFSSEVTTEGQKKLTRIRKKCQFVEKFIK